MAALVPMALIQYFQPLVIRPNGIRFCRNQWKRLGKKQNGKVEILAGLREGESIYVDAYKQLAQQVNP